MRKITLAALLAFSIAVLLAQTAFAVPALEMVFTVRQPDGTAFEVFTRGDERAHWTVSEADDYILAQNDDHWWCFAEVVNGRLRPTSVHYGRNAVPPKTATKEFSPPQRFRGG